MASPQLTYRKAVAVLVVAVIAFIAYFALYRPWIEGKQPISDEEMRVMDQQMQDTTLNLQTQLSADLSIHQLAEEQARQSSETGLGLGLRCSQWTEVNETRATEDSQKYMDWACKRYNHYVTRGELLPDEPPDQP